MKGKDRLIVALDVATLDQAERMIDILAGEVEIFKVGIAPFTGFGQAILKKLRSSGKKVFLDLKVHDIPNTARNAAQAAAREGVFMMNFHCLGGESMLRAAVEGAGKADTKEGQKPPLLLGVTILTSMDTEEMEAVGLAGGTQKKVSDLAQIAWKAGLDGVVASAREARMIKKETGEAFLVVTPGIRPEWSATGDQKRVLTPRGAMDEGADYIVVGRPILQADDPAEAARRIIEEMEEGP